MFQRVHHSITLISITILLVLGGCSSSDSEPASAAAVPDKIELNWGQYGPFDDFSEAAYEAYSGNPELGEVSPEWASRIFDTLTYGPFSDMHTLNRHKSVKDDRTFRLQRLFNQDVFETSGEFWNWSEPGKKYCESGEKDVYILLPNDNTQGVRLRLVEYDNCREGDVTLNGYLYVSSDAHDATSGNSYIAYDGVEISTRYNTLQVFGAATIKASTACEDARTVKATLLFDRVTDNEADPLDQILLDDFVLDWGSGIFSNCSNQADSFLNDEGRFSFNRYNGTISLNTGGVYSVKTPRGMSRDSDMETLFSETYDPEYEVKQERPMTVYGANSGRSSLNYELTGVSTQNINKFVGFNWQDYFAVIEVSTDNQAVPEVYRSTYSEYRQGALSNLGDVDEDGMPDSWELRNQLAVDASNKFDDRSSINDTDKDGWNDLVEYISLSDVRAEDKYLLTNDSSISVALTNYFTEEGDPRIRAIVNVGQDPRDVPAMNVKTEIVANEGIEWMSDSLEDGCMVHADSPNIVECSQRGTEADSEGIAKTLIFEIDPTITTPESVDVTVSTTSTAIDRDVANNVASDSMVIDRDFPVDFVLTVPSKEFVSLNKTRTVTATVEQQKIAPAQTVLLSVEATEGVSLQNIVSSVNGVRSLIARCSSVSPIICEFDDIETGDIIEVILNYSTVSENDDMRLEWQVISDALEFDKINNVVSTEVDVVRSMDELRAIVDLANDGDVVQLPSGVYLGTLDLDHKTLFMSGSSEGRTTLVSYGTGEPTLTKIGRISQISNIDFRTDGAPAVDVGGDNITLSDSTFEPIQGISHKVDKLFELYEGNSFRMLRNTFKGWGSDSESECQYIFAHEKSFSYEIVAYIQQNTFVDNNCDSIVYGNSSLHSLVDYYFMNNTFVNNTRVAHFEGLQKQNAKLQFYNNIFVKTGEILLVEGSPFEGKYPAGTDLNKYGGLKTSRNLVWESSRATVLTEELVSKQEVVLGFPDINVDPQFVNAENGDFRLSEGSPAIDAGDDVTPYVWWFSNSNYDHLTLADEFKVVPVDGDSDGIARFDIGAHEYAP